MFKGIVLLFILILQTFCGSSQAVLRFVVTDAATGAPIPNVAVVAKGDLIHTITNNEGNAHALLPQQDFQVLFSKENYKPLEVFVKLPATRKDSTIRVSIEKGNDKASTIIYSYRTNKTLGNSPTQTDLVTTEALELESNRKSSHIANLLGDHPGIQPQQTSAINNNIVLRMQGLPGSYTQLLRDGMPLFGGYAGNFALIQVPPLDLKQVEIIKGSNSLYGGGSIGGLINIISKRPVRGEKERYLQLNQSTLRESNLHLFLSERTGKVGYTFFTGANYQRQEDVNNDGFSDRARIENAFIHPTFYFYPNTKNTISLGISSYLDNRKGGDMQILEGYFSNSNQFSIQNQTYRNTLDLIWENTISSTDKFTLKGTTSNFNRNITTSTFGMKAKQLSYFAEASYLKKIPKHDFVAGMNLTGENLNKRNPDSTLFNDYNYFAVGLFLQDDWQINNRMILETGLRTDFHNIFKAFVLPRFSLLYRVSDKIDMRLGAAAGYRIPNLFESTIDERDYRKILPLSIPVIIEAERSIGANWNFIYQHQKNKTAISFSQGLFFNRVADPILYDTLGGGEIFYFNAEEPILTYGAETNFQVQHKSFEISLNYNFTNAKKQYYDIQPWLELNARHRASASLAWKINKKFSGLFETIYTGFQYLDNGSQTPGYFISNASLRYVVGHFSFVLHARNLADYRQSYKEDILIGPLTNPRFRQLWAPIDGRVINLSMKIRI